MTLYLLDHRHWIDSDYYDTKFIGIYSSYDFVSQTIERYSQLPGFCDLKTDFHIESFKIDLTKAQLNKGFVYLVTGTQMLDDDDDEITVSYYVYLSLFWAKLISMIKSIKSQGRNKRKFYVEKYYINKDNWTEGFVVIEN